MSAKAHHKIPITLALALALVPAHASTHDGTHATERANTRSRHAFGPTARIRNPTLLRERAPSRAAETASWSRLLPATPVPGASGPKGGRKTAMEARPAPWSFSAEAPGVHRFFAISGCAGTSGNHKFRSRGLGSATAGWGSSRHAGVRPNSRPETPFDNDVRPEHVRSSPIAVADRVARTCGVAMGSPTPMGPQELMEPPGHMGRPELMSPEPVDPGPTASRELMCPLEHMGRPKLMGLTQAAGSPMSPGSIGSRDPCGRRSPWGRRSQRTPWSRQNPQGRWSPSGRRGASARGRRWLVRHQLMQT